jgi:hypothetical protein
MSNTTESPFSLTLKVGANNDLLTGRADTVDEMSVRIQQLQALAQQMQGVPAPVTQEVTPAQAVQNVVDAGMAAETVTPGAIEVKEDQWGNKFTRGNPDAGSCVHGPRIVKNGTNRSGKAYKAFVCVNDSPFREGKYDKNSICEIAWPPRR